MCGGSIIADSYIMTAGHCVENEIASSITVYVGSIRLFEGDALTVSRIYLHPLYYMASLEGYVLHDIALLKLSQPLSSTNGIWAKVCLPKYNTILTNNTDLTAIGWGRTKEESQYASETLQQVTVKLINSDTAWCRNIARNASIQFCAGVMPYGGKGK
jgi:secreted trypsin-like serine protease